jgi:Ca-activated chloride channel family protein
MKIGAAIVLCVAAEIVGAPQQPAPFRSRVDAVRVDVLVTDGRKPIGGLTRDDFAVSDNGAPQAIEDLTIEEVPFSMLLALDTSSSVAGGPLKDLQRAARSAADALRPSDRACVLTFWEDIQTLSHWEPRGPALIEAISKARAGGATGLFDAALVAVLHRDPEPGRRGLVLLFTDGDDTASWLPGRAVLDAAARTDAVVYTVSLGRPSVNAPLKTRSGTRLAPTDPILDATPFLNELADRTGGEMLIQGTMAALDSTFEHIVTEFRSRYLLTYSPQNVDAGGWHRIDVRLTKRSGKVKARRGYQR